jgi:hypothetical protein
MGYRMLQKCITNFYGTQAAFCLEQVISEEPDPHSYKHWDEPHGKTPRNIIHQSVCEMPR